MGMPRKPSQRKKSSRPRLRMVSAAGQQRVIPVFKNPTANLTSRLLSALMHNESLSEIREDLTRQLEQRKKRLQTLIEINAPIETREKEFQLIAESEVTLTELKRQWASLQTGAGLDHFVRKGFEPLLREEWNLPRPPTKDVSFFLGQLVYDKGVNLTSKVLKDATENCMRSLKWYQMIQYGVTMLSAPLSARSQKHLNERIRFYSELLERLRGFSRLSRRQREWLKVYFERHQSRER